MIRTGVRGVKEQMTVRTATALICALLLASGCARGGDERPASTRAPATAAPGAVEEVADPDPGDPTAPGGQSARGGRSGGQATPAPSIEPPKPYAQVRENERVTWEQALEWWPYRPLLRFDGPPKPGLEGHDAVFATSRKGGRKGNPREEFCVLTTFWMVPGADSDNATFLQMVDAGGMAVSARFYPPSLAFKGQAGGKAVIVRGQNAWMYELRTDQAEADKHEWRIYGTQDIRYIQWQEYLPRDSGTIDWLMMTHATKYTEQETIAAANSMARVR